MDGTLGTGIGGGGAAEDSPGLAALERAFDGPIPRPLRLAARLGGARAFELERARASVRFWRGAAQTHLAALRALRGAADGGARARAAGHAADLGLARAKHGAYVRWLAALERARSLAEARAVVRGAPFADRAPRR
ncbi:MAG: hypothetical protein HY521_15095 [Proteobacteria bacterium]|nr:hypothetical protein [Pseudomonadota bacterium]